MRLNKALKRSIFVFSPGRDEGNDNWKGEECHAQPKESVALSVRNHVPRQTDFIPLEQQQFGAWSYIYRSRERALNEESDRPFDLERRKISYNLIALIKPIEKNAFRPIKPKTPDIYDSEQIGKNEKF